MLSQLPLSNSHPIVGDSSVPHFSFCHPPPLSLPFAFWVSCSHSSAALCSFPGFSFSVLSSAAATNFLLWHGLLCFLLLDEFESASPFLRVSAIPCCHHSYPCLCSPFSYSLTPVPKVQSWECLQLCLQAFCFHLSLPIANCHCNCTQPQADFHPVQLRHIKQN